MRNRKVNIYRHTACVSEEWHTTKPVIPAAQKSFTELMEVPKTVSYSLSILTHFYKMRCFTF
jgi:hypothetical protein